MSGCCSGGSRVLVEVERLVLAGETCERCGDTWTAAQGAVASVQAELAGIGLSVDLIERPLPPERIGDSNRVLVSGRPVEDWLGGAVSMTDCPSCGELVGEPSCCRSYEIGGVASDALSAEDISRAIRIAAGLAAQSAPVGVPASAAVPGSRPVHITLVTSPECG